MTRVDFYLLSGAAGSPVAAVCRLCEKAVGAGNRLYLRTGDAGLADELDGALWSFKQGGFIAHERHNGAPIEEPPPPVLIGDHEPPASHHGVLINLDNDVPTWFSSFERVLEVVPEDVAQRAHSRERFRFYRERGYELKTFEQTAEGGWQAR
ncbi:MAG: polymerase subunit chi [Panacagrimonas sp.]|nr:DNA polymerase III subunit chi [Panacagrimonas sp.]MCC2658286.1 polymerase subunit chi [Panacagrimonas sp.]